MSVLVPLGGVFLVSFFVGWLVAGLISGDSMLVRAAICKASFILILVGSVIFLFSPLIWVGCVFSGISFGAALATFDEK